MKKIGLHILFTLFVSGWLSAQRNCTDSLEAALNNTYSNERIALFNRLSDVYASYFAPKSIEYAYLARQFAIEANDDAGLAEACFQLARVNYKLGVTDVAAGYRDNSLKYFRRMGDSLGVARALSLIVADAPDEDDWYDEILNYACALEVKHSDKQIFAQHLYANYFAANKNSKLALKYYIAAGERTAVSVEGVLLYLDVARFCIQEQDYAGAQNYLDRGGKWAQQLGLPYANVDILLLKAEVAVQNNHTELALGHLEQAKKLASDLGYARGLAACYRGFANLFDHNDNIAQAYYYITKYQAMTDSLAREQQRERADKLSNSFELNKELLARELAEKEAEIQRLDNERQASQNHVQRTLIIIFVLLVVVLLLIVLYFYSGLRNKRMSEMRFRQLAGAAFEGILIVNDNKIVEYNENILTMSQYSGVELKLKPLPELIAVVESTKSNTTDNGESYETKLLQRSGETIEVEVHEKPFWYKGNHVKVFAIHNITERKQTEKELLENAEQLKAMNATKDKLFSIIGHDLKGTFWNFKIAFDALWEDFFELDKEELKQMLSSLKNASDSTYDLLENLLNWARIQRGKSVFRPVVLSLHALVTENIKLLEASGANKKISLKHDIDPDINIRADRDMVMTVLRNLMSNAIKFTNNGGTVKVSAWSSKDVVQVSVSDNGVGISPENAAKLFKIDTHYSTFGTGNEKGSGLGLLLCKEFVEKNKGEIWVDSQEGRGTIFKFTLLKE